MAQQDQITVRIPDADMAEIRAAISVLQEKLSPHLTILNAQDRMELPKMGDKTVAFVRKAWEYSRRYKELAPAWYDPVAMESALRAVESLREISQLLGPLGLAVDDSLTLSGSKAFQGALVFYSGVKAATKAKAPNAAVVCEDLSARFPGTSGKKKE